MRRGRVASIEDIVSGAIFDFAGKLTSMKDDIQIGSHSECAIVVKLIEEFANERGLFLDEADVTGWQDRLSNKIAKDVIALRKKFKRGDNIYKELRKLLGRGEAEFVYEKKDGSKKTRIIVPLEVFKLRGRWVVKGYETRDSRKIEKVFFLNMISGVGEDKKQSPYGKIDERLSLNEMKKKVLDAFGDEIKGSLMDEVHSIDDNAIISADWILKNMNPKKWAVIFFKINNGDDGRVHLAKIKLKIGEEFSDAAWYQDVTLFLDIGSEKDEDNVWNPNGSGFRFRVSSKLGRKSWRE